MPVSHFPKPWHSCTDWPLLLAQLMPLWLTGGVMSRGKQLSICWNQPLPWGREKPLIVTMSHTQFWPNLIDFDFLYSISFSSSLLAQQHSESLSWSPPLLPLCHHYFEGCIPLDVLLLWLEVSSWMLPLLKRWTHQWPSVLESLVMLVIQDWKVMPRGHSQTVVYIYIWISYIIDWSFVLNYHLVSSIAFLLHYM